MLGAPALSFEEYQHYQQGVIVGLSLQVTAPLGQYDSDKLINIGTNRWSVKPEIGVSKSWKRLTLDLMTGVRFYTDNEEFLGDRKLEKEPLYSIQAHAIYTIWRAVCGAGEFTYYGRGGTTIDRRDMGEPQENTRVGGTLLLPSTATTPSKSTAVPAQPRGSAPTSTASESSGRPALNPVATNTLPATPTAIRTPPALPAVFVGPALNSLDTPHTYIQDSCQYLRDKWTSTNSTPGTIVLVVMFHSIEKGVETANDPKNIGGGDFRRLMNALHDMGFQEINASQLADFLDSNAKIPERSVVLIQDDRHSASNYTDWFLPYWEQWQWPVINAWINALGGDDPVLAENVALEQQGWFDHQSRVISLQAQGNIRRAAS